MTTPAAVEPFSAPDVSPGRALRTLRDQADALMGNSLLASVGPVVGALMLWGAFYSLTKDPLVLVWAVLIHAIQVVRVAMHLRYLRTPTLQRQPLSSIGSFRAMLVATSVIWGLSPWFFYPPNDIPLACFMLLMLLGMMATRLGWLSNYRPALFWFVVPSLSLLTAALLWQRTPLNVGLAVFTFVFMLINLRLGIKQNTLLTAASHTRYDNEDLSRRLAEQLRIAEAASLEKTRFFASASHDLRQPLHSLGLFGSAIVARLKGTDDEPLARNLMHCVDALETSFSAMLDVSKLDAGVVIATPQVVSVADIFKRLDINFGRQAQAQGVALRFKPAGKGVSVDPLLLQRMLGNLIHNALKFTEQGGVVVVARTHGKNVSIEVWDTGCGITAQELPRIFDEFYQIGNRERDRSMGLGMGLAIVRRLSELMRIPLQVKSRPGRGTVFKLLVPAANAQLNPAVLRHENSSSAMRAIAGQHVLVVDDEENVRVSTAAALRLYGLVVHTADGVQAACEIALRLEGSATSSGKLSAVITDFRLRNEEDGIQLAAKLRAELGRNLPVLLVTGDTAPERVKQAQASGYPVLYKPVKAHEMAEALRQLMA